MDVQNHSVMGQNTRWMDDTVKAQETLATGMRQVLTDKRARQLVQHSQSEADGGNDANKGRLLQCMNQSKGDAHDYTIWLSMAENEVGHAIPNGTPNIL